MEKQKLAAKKLKILKSKIIQKGSSSTQDISSREQAQAPAEVKLQPPSISKRQKTSVKKSAANEDGSCKTISVQNDVHDVEPSDNEVSKSANDRSGIQDDHEMHTNDPEREINDERVGQSGGTKSNKDSFKTGRAQVCILLRSNIACEELVT